MPQELQPTDEIYPVIDRVRDGAHVDGIEKYRLMWDESVNDPDEFWGKLGREQLSWFQPFTKVRSGGFEEGDIAWFLDGKINVSYNCLDRHLDTKGDQVAIISEGDDPSKVTKITYRELHKQVCKLANFFKSLGLRKGDGAAIYMPNCPEATVTMLACARIGVIHSSVFAGFSSDSLASRIIDASCKVVITADELTRGGKVVPLKKTVDAALLCCPSVEKVIVLKKTGGKVPFKEGRDVWFDEALVFASLFIFFLFFHSS